MTNYDGIDRLSPGDEDQLRDQQRAWERNYADIAAGKPLTIGCWSCTGTQNCSGVCSKPPACTFCGRPDDTQTGTCVRCEVVADRGREWDEGAEAS